MVKPEPGKGRLYLLRHGQGSLGTADYDRLSAIGQRQSLALGDRIHQELPAAAQRPWCGTLKRHGQTLERLNPLTDPVVDPALNEYTVDGLIQSALAQAIHLGLEPPGEQAFADPKAYLETFLAWFPEVLTAWQDARLDCEHNGSWIDFRRRVLSPVSRWRQDMALGLSPVVVTSAGVISTVVADLLGEDLTWQRELNVSLYNASVTVLEMDDSGGWRAPLINCVIHLEGATERTLA
ncbi:MAG: hypothetical protein EA370_15410 [Wenzhouxiangella sp.]|nr:MAG: hypothetical protein EA370_15410 [Wenzhouxiangella sp.]